MEAGDGEVDVQSRANIFLRAGRGRGQKGPRNGDRRWAPWLGGSCLGKPEEPVGGRGKQVVAKVPGSCLPGFLSPLRWG